MVHALPLNFSIHLEELFTSMVYIGVKVMTYNRIYNDGVEKGAATSVLH